VKKNEIEKKNNENNNNENIIKINNEIIMKEIMM